MGLRGGLNGHEFGTGMSPARDAAGVRVEARSRCGYGHYERSLVKIAEACSGLVEKLVTGSSDARSPLFAQIRIASENPIRLRDALHRRIGQQHLQEATIALPGLLRWIVKGGWVHGTNAVEVAIRVPTAVERFVFTSHELRSSACGGLLVLSLVSVIFHPQFLGHTRTPFLNVIGIIV